MTIAFDLSALLTNKIIPWIFFVTMSIFFVVYYRANIYFAIYMSTIFLLLLVGKLVPFNTKSFSFLSKKMSIKLTTLLLNILALASVFLNVKISLFFNCSRYFLFYLKLQNVTLDYQVHNNKILLIKISLPTTS